MIELKENKQNESGIAMVVALLTLLVLSTLATGMIFVTQSGMWSTANYKAVTQARFEAEAGLQRSLQWFNSAGYVYASGATYTTSTTDGSVYWNGQPVVLSGITGKTSNYPTSTVSDSFSTNLGNQGLTPAAVTGTTWSYSAMATLLRRNAGQETWKVVSQGTIPGARAATVQAEMVIERRGEPVFKWAWYGSGTGCKNVMFGGSGGGTDSFDSSAGTYAATKQVTDGDVGSNGNIFLKSANDVGGMAYSPMTNTATTNNCVDATPQEVSLCGPSCVVREGIQQLSAPTVFANPPAVSPAPTNAKAIDLRNSCTSTPGCSVVTPDAVFALAPGNYNNLLLGGGKTLQISAGTYNVNSLDFTGGTILKVMSGPIVVNVAGNGLSGSDQAINMGGGAIANDSGIPSNLTFYYGGSQSIELTGGSGNYSLLYAPNADTVIGGGGGWFGAGITKSLELTGGSMLHYDRALGAGSSSITPGPFRPISFTRSKY